jgi:AP2-like factor, euAP2 lineage
MKQIPVSFGEFALIDDDDYEKVSQYNWATQKRPSPRTNKIAVRTFKNKGGWWSNEFLHRFILGASSEMCVMFKDNNGLNCQKENLVVMKKGSFPKKRNKNDNLQRL